MSRYLALSPWAKDALTPDELGAITGRAVALGAHVSAGSSRGPGRWSVWVTSETIRVGHDDCRGSLADAINHHLDAFREKGLAMVWCSGCEADAIVNLDGEGWCEACLAKREVAA